MPWTYKPKPDTITVDPAIRQRVVDVARGHKVRGIRLLREETGLPLTFAVALVERWLQEAAPAPSE